MDTTDIQVVVAVITLCIGIGVRSGVFKIALKYRSNADRAVYGVKIDQNLKGKKAAETLKLSEADISHIRKPD